MAADLTADEVEAPDAEAQEQPCRLGEPGEVAFRGGRRAPVATVAAGEVASGGDLEVDAGNVLQRVALVQELDRLLRQRGGDVLHPTPLQPLPDLVVARIGRLCPGQREEPGFSR